MGELVGARYSLGPVVHLRHIGSFGHFQTIVARCFSCTLATCLPPLGPLHRAVLDLLAEEIPRLEGLVPLTARAENRVVRAESPLPVSYTHLTLPTICSV